MSTEKTDYTTEAQERLLSTLQGATKLEALAASYTDRCQELEAEAYDLLEQRSIENAVGDRLDQIGWLFNVPRSGRLDEPYRLRLRAEIAILNSDGTASALMGVVRLLFALPDLDIEYSEGQPKTAVLRPRDYASLIPDWELDDILDLLRRAAPSGTDVELVVSGNKTSDADIFHFSNTADTTESLATYGTENGSVCQNAK